MGNLASLEAAQQYAAPDALWCHSGCLTSNSSVSSRSFSVIVTTRGKAPPAVCYTANSLQWNAVKYLLGRIT